MKLTFNGAAGNVTGSCYLLETARAKVVVDCGLFQERKLSDRNWGSFPFDPASVSAVVLTHAHLDHCGLLPKLVREGFAGKIICTPATAEIAGIVMSDSARIQVEDVKRKQERHQREGRVGPHPYEPLYTVQDAEAAIARFETAHYGKETAAADGVSCEFNDAGHILGSSWVRLTVRENGTARSLVFSGDVGRPGTPILKDPVKPAGADVLVVESTYGNRTHKPEAGVPDSIARIVNQTVRAGGNVVVPTFAVERAQELLFHVGRLRKSERIPPVTVFLDSPMAIDVTELFRRHEHLFDEETKGMLRRGEHPCSFPNLRMCRSADESKAIKAHKGTALILAGSGMCTGGRVKHHLVANLERRDSTILFVGYQASGTLGRIILEGAEKVRIFGEEREIAARVEKVNGFSAHADREELLDWLSEVKTAPGRVFVAHGEPEASKAFASELKRRKAWKPEVPGIGDSFELGA